MAGAFGKRLGVEVLETWEVDPSRFRVNHILQPDAPQLHNHPWEFCWALILSGGYTHEFAYLQADGTLGPRELRTFKPGDINFMPNALFHRIESVEPNTFTQIYWGPNVDPQVNHVLYWTPEGLMAQRQIQDYIARTSA